MVREISARYKRERWQRVILDFRIRIERCSMKSSGSSGQAISLSTKKKGVFHLVIGNHRKVLRIVEELATRCIIKRADLVDLIGFIKSRQWKNDTGLYVVSREELYKLYWEKQLSVQEIAKIFNRARKSVEHKMVVLGIPRRSLSEALKIAWRAGRKKASRSKVLASDDLSGKEPLLGYFPNR